RSVAIVGGCLLSVGLLVVVELRAAEPIVQIHLRRNNTAGLRIVPSLAVCVAMFGPAVFLTQYQQLGKGHTSTAAGLMILPMVVCQTLSSTAAGIVVTRTWEWRPTMLVGRVMM